MAVHKKTENYSYYIIGFIFSLIFTLAAYFFVQINMGSHHQPFSYGVIIAIIITLALAQLVAQLTFFLHLHKESKPRWNLMVLILAVMVVGIVVFGSLWIMQNLNYHTHPQDVEEYIIKDEGYSEKQNER